MVKITRRFTFSAGHRLSLHQGACQQIHGHNYVLEVTVYRKDGRTDENCMVVDFHYLSEKISRWLKENWDHALVLSETDEKALAVAQDFKVCRITGEPTAENMAYRLFHFVIPKLLEDLSEVRVDRVVLWENENSRAEVYE